jgi:uncharacterized SAM-binding protein YcdF (DUF218 family)
MFFVIKKIVSGFFMPLPLILLILLCGLIFLWFTKKQRTGKIITSCGILLIIAFGYSPFTNLLIQPLEHLYPKCEGPGVSVMYVVVLGGGSSADDQLPISSQLSRPSLARLVEGIKVYRENSGSVLVLSGFGGKDEKSNAEIMADVAMSLGVPDYDIIKEPLSRNTHEEALNIKKIVGTQPFALVTSAAHMKRAMMLFEEQKTNPIPMPTDYLVKKGNGDVGIELPSSGGYLRAESATHEYLGILYAKIRILFNNLYEIIHTRHL